MFSFIQILLNFFWNKFFSKRIVANELFNDGTLSFWNNDFTYFNKNLFENKKMKLRLTLYLFSLFFTFSVSVIISIILSVLLFFYWKIINNKKISLKITIFISVFIIALFISFKLRNNHFGCGTMSSLNEKYLFLNENLILEIKEPLNYIHNFIFNYEFYKTKILTIHSLISNVKIAISTLIHSI